MKLYSVIGYDGLPSDSKVFGVFDNKELAQRVFEDCLNEDLECVKETFEYENGREITPEELEEIKDVGFYECDWNIINGGTYWFVRIEEHELNEQHMVIV